MFLVDHIVEKIVDPIVEPLISCIGGQFGYVLDCNQIIDDFAIEVEKVRHAKKRVQRKRDEALNNAEELDWIDTYWMNQVESLLPKMEDDSGRLVQAKENMLCFDVFSRYRMGREAKKKLSRLSELLSKRGYFGKSSTVAYRPPLTDTWFNTYSIKYESFTSRDLPFQQIMDALKDDRIYKIGIYGMPGVGKTRMMQEAAQQAQKQGLFDDIAKTVVGEKPNFKDIQLKLAESLNLNLDKETEGARKELLHNRLKNGKKILVLVDDMWDDLTKLEEIGIPAADDHTPGCKVVLTSRRKDVCENMGVQDPFEIGVLSKNEAWSLFEKKVGDSINHPGMQSIAEEVCGQCAELPLAIVAVGGALQNKKSKQEWEDALDQLIGSRGDKIGGKTAAVYSSIKLSYDKLDPIEAQSIFLLCCLFSEDADISVDDLTVYAFGRRLLEGVDTMRRARNRVHTLIKTLKTHSLLLEGKSEEFVKLHDVIRDAAISIASKSKDDKFLVKDCVENWPEEDEYRDCSTISLRFNNDCVFPDELQCPGLRSLRLECSGDNCSVPSSFFNGMENLEVLDLCGISISALPSSLKTVRALHLYHCGPVNLSFLKKLKKLVILSIDDFRQEQLAPEISLLTSMRVLDLRNCNELKMFPSGVISSLARLEELYIPDEFDQWEVNGNASLTELQSLRFLTSLQIHVPNGMLLPLKELQRKPLNRFIISIGSVLEYFETRSSATKILKLEGIAVNTELSIFIDRAEVLSLRQVKGLKDVFRNKQFPDLMYLKVDDCDGEENLFLDTSFINSSIYEPVAFRPYRALIVLEVSNCQMKSLFSLRVAMGLSQLQELDIRNCGMLEEIILDDRSLVRTSDGMLCPLHICFWQLKTLKLWRLPNLRCFVDRPKQMSTMSASTSFLGQALFDNNDTVSFPALVTLEIYELKSLTAIWDNQSFLGLEAHNSFGLLNLVSVVGCDKLVNVIPPNVVPSFQNLLALLVESCCSVVSVVEVAAIEEVSDEIILFPKLLYLGLRKLRELRSVFYMSTSGKEGSGMVLVFPELSDLEFEELPWLRSFSCSRRGGEELSEVGNIPQRRHLFNHKVHFPILTTLTCYGIFFEGFWKDHLLNGSFGKLRFLKVEKNSSFVDVSILLQ